MVARRAAGSRKFSRAACCFSECGLRQARLGAPQKRRTLCVKKTGADIVDIRQAEEKDIAAIYSFDHLAHVEQRRKFIQNSVRSGTASVAVLDDKVVGYAVLEYTFYAQGFIAMLYIHPECRHNGVGSKIVRYLESICKTEKLFTSTNESNLPMQALMKKLNYIPSGIINNLDEGDPELVYFKRVHKRR